ncbi:MAG: hypothetical protein AAAB35_06430, partial [Phyllobacterium sp.]|uniref:hypothetical protein n=1 Tax=Phyllobacterium sp. TaxID=1871046 RepID=UPI0030F30ECD
GHFDGREEARAVDPRDYAGNGTVGTTPTPPCDCPTEVHLPQKAVEPEGSRHRLIMSASLRCFASIAATVSLPNGMRTGG